MGSWGSGEGRGHPSPSAKEPRRPGHLAVVGLLKLKKKKADKYILILKNIVFLSEIQFDVLMATLTVGPWTLLVESGPHPGGAGGKAISPIGPSFLASCSFWGVAVSRMVTSQGFFSTATVSSAEGLGVSLALFHHPQTWG